ncbi:hypothetical protein MMPV_006413 [Pyropia vietnamensis]
MAEWVARSRTTRLQRSFHLPGPRVDAIGYGASYSVLFASEAQVSNEEPYVPTRRVKVHPPTDAEARSLMVRAAGDPFEVRLAGVQAANHDASLPGARKNELVIYSVHKDPTGMAADGVPLVHYDFSTARESTAAGVYFPIPASKSVVARGGIATCGGPAAAGLPRSHLNIRLVVLEVDDVAALKTSVESVENLTGGLAALSSSLGVAGVGALGSAMRVAGALSREALDKHAKPDRVLAVDMDFRLPPPPPAPLPSYSSEFLMRGYYFFLSKPCDAALYAQTNTSDNVRLVARRSEGRGWAPLTHISYVVVRVSVPYDTAPVGPVGTGDADRVESLFAQAPVGGEGVLSAVAGAAGFGVGGGAEEGDGGQEGATSGGSGGRDASGSPSLGASLAWASALTGGAGSRGGGNVIDVILDAYERRRAMVASPTPPVPPAPVPAAAVVPAAAPHVTLQCPPGMNIAAGGGERGLAQTIRLDLAAAEMAAAEEAPGSSDSGEVAVGDTQ